MMIALRSPVIGTAIRMVPVVLIVILSFPAWLTWPFLSEERRKSVLQMVHALGQWAMGDSSDEHDGDDQIAGRHSIETTPDKPPIDGVLRSVFIEGCNKLG